MPGSHGTRCPCGYEWTPHSHGYRCAGGHHYLNSLGQNPNEEHLSLDEEEERLLKELHQASREANEAQCLFLKGRMKKLRKSRKEFEKRVKCQEEGKRMDREQRRAREHERSEKRRAGQKEDFDKQRRESLELIRAIHDAQLQTFMTEQAVKDAQPAPLVTDTRVGSSDFPWMRNQGEHQPEPETAGSR